MRPSAERITFPADARAGRNWSRRFGTRLAAIVLLAVGLRVLYALRYAPHLGWGDGTTFHLLANRLADGHGFIGAQQYEATGVVQPTAEHPPLYPLLLAGFSKLGLTSWTAHRLVSCALGAAMVTAVGFLGRRVGGPSIGLLTAAVAALYPQLIIQQGMVASEALYGLMVALTLLAAFRVLDRPTARRAAVLGGVIGLSALTRSEALLFLPLLTLPVVLLARERRWRNLGVACVAAVVVLAPWTIRSSVVFDRPLFTTNVGGVLAGANCDRTYYGPFTGLWLPVCWEPGRPGADEGERSAQLRHQGISYAGDHLTRLPVVALVRVLRAWELYKPGQGASYERAIEGHHMRIHQLGVRFYYGLLALAALGIVVLRRQRAELTVLLAPVVLATATVALTLGTSRYRLAADVPLMILAATGLVALRERLVPWLSRARAR